MAVSSSSSIEPVAGACPDPLDLLVRLVLGRRRDAARSDDAAAVVEVDADDVGELARQAQHLRRAAADHERGTRTLQRLRDSDVAGGLDELALVVDLALARVGHAHELRRLAQQLDAPARGLEGDAHALVLVDEPARAEPDLEPALGQHVDGGHLLGEHRRQVVADARHARADAQRRRGHRGRREGGDERERLHAVPRALDAAARAQQMVGHEEGREPAVLHLADEVDPLGPRRGAEGLDGEAERTGHRGAFRAERKNEPCAAV